VIKPTILLTMSSSGGKWLASTVARHTPGCRYYDKEYFNPWCNPAREVALRRYFGCEQAACYRNIATHGDGEIDATIAETWGVDGFNFTKEVFSAFKVGAFIRNGFNIVGLVRRTDDCLPPKRSNVWNCYEHTWQALEDAGVQMPGHTGRERAYEAHAYIRKTIIDSGDIFGFPVIHFDFLQEAPANKLHDALGGAFGHVTQNMVEELMATRFREA
jgi:hypothetical protein